MDASSPPAARSGPGYARFVPGVLTVMYTFNYLDRYVLTILVGHIKADPDLSDVVRPAN